jgi:hypothetical protein
MVKSQANHQESVVKILKNKKVTSCLESSEMGLVFYSHTVDNLLNSTPPI